MALENIDHALKNFLAHGFLITAEENLAKIVSLEPLVP